MKHAFEPTSCWDAFKGRAKQMDTTAKAYAAFLTRCKTERETVDYVMEKAAAKGFADSLDGELFVRAFRGKTVFLARKGEAPLAEGSRLVAAHLDTPHLDLKQRPLLEDVGVCQAKTHYYGGIRKHQWLARELAIHGVVVKADGETVSVVLGEDPSEPVFTIADLLPHLARKQNEQKLSEAFEAEKLNLVMGHQPDPEAKKKDKDTVKALVLKVLNEKYGIVEEDLYSAELHAVPAGPARLVGLDGAMVGGYGQDDRCSVFCGLEAFLAAAKPGFTRMALFWDKEEIGSDGATGAKAKFFEYCMADMLEAWEPQTRLRQAFLAMRALSADVHIGLDPDYKDLHEPLNAAKMGYGPCFCKFTGHGGKYGASDADAEYVAWVRNILNKKKIPWQMAEFGKVDLGGGGTVAKHLAEYGMHVIDVGPPVMSMHSPFELSSKADVYATIQAFKAFYEG